MLLLLLLLHVACCIMLLLLLLLSSCCPYKIQTNISDACLLIRLPTHTAVRPSREVMMADYYWLPLVLRSASASASAAASFSLAAAIADSSRAPKMVEPMRTFVLPCAMASS